MKTIVTHHPDIGYRNNVEVIEQALRSYFGFDDNSHMLTAVAAHIWSAICHKGEEKRWGSAEVVVALNGCQARLDVMREALAQASRNSSESKLTRKHTAFGSFEEMLTAEGGYRPSFYIRGRDPADALEIEQLADAYDAEQVSRGDSRRAYRGDFGPARSALAA